MENIVQAGRAPTNIPHHFHWRKYCGFLELSVKEWEAIQSQLLNEQLQFLANAPWYRRLLGKKCFASQEEFRQRAPLTSYSDYSELLLKKQEAALPEKPVYWCYTLGPGGTPRWFPYTQRAMDRVADHICAAFILAAARRKGDIRIGPGDYALYTVAPKPHLAGFLSYMLQDRFGLRAIPPLEQADSMDLRHQVESGFKTALTTGVDVLCCSSSVLLRIGEHFVAKRKADGFHGTRVVHPAALGRLFRAWLRCKLARRPLLPRDLWRPKALVVWGLNSPEYLDQLTYYWGTRPYQFYACTEAGVLALRSWNKRGLTPVPCAAFMEFIPEEELARLEGDRNYNAKTLLLGGLRPGEKYEVVLTSFHGMPLVRYRTGHLVKVLAHEDVEAAVRLPQIEQVGRVGQAAELADAVAGSIGEHPW